MTDIEAIYAWTEIDADNQEGVVAFAIPTYANMMIPLQHRDLSIARQMRAMAQRHQYATGHRVRLVQFTRTKTLETIENS